MAGDPIWRGGHESCVDGRQSAHWYRARLATPAISAVPRHLSQCQPLYLSFAAALGSLTVQQW
jgi:hypothetical protein